MQKKNLRGLVSTKVKDQGIHPESIKKLVPVQVIWHDAFSQSGWGDCVQGPLECVSVGLLVHADHKCVCIAQNWNDTTFGEYMTIPRRMVLKVKKLK